MTEATAVKDNVSPMVRKGAAKAVAAAVAEPAPPVAATVLAIDPLSEYRADAHRRKQDAQGEIDLLMEQERLADLLLAARIKKADDEHNRFVAFEGQKRDAEHRQVELEIDKYRQIVNGAEAALEATDAPAVDTDNDFKVPAERVE